MFVGNGSEDRMECLLMMVFLNRSPRVGPCHPNRPSGKIVELALVPGRFSFERLKRRHPRRLVYLFLPPILLERDPYLSL